MQKPVDLDLRPSLPEVIRVSLLTVSAVFLAIAKSHQAFVPALEPPAPTMDEIRYYPPKVYELPTAKAPKDKAPTSIPTLEMETPVQEIKPIDIQIDPFQIPTHSGDPTFGVAGILGPMESPLPNFEDLDAAPRPLVRIAPEVPYKQYAAEFVDAILTVDESGTVRRVEIQKCSDQRLETPARRAFFKWRFEPGMKDGHPSPFKIRQRIDLKIE